MRTKRAAIIGIALLSALLGTAACSSSDDSASRDVAASSAYAQPSAAAGGAASDAEAEAAQPPSPGGVQESKAPGAEDNSGESASGAGSASAEINAALADRQVIKTATVQVELTIPIDTATEKVEDVKRDTVAGATANLSAQATVLGGFVGSLDQSGASATLVLRVPVDKYDALLKAVGTVGGEITNINEAAQDVTAQVTDIESRIKSQETSVERIRALLAEATNLEDIIRLESELSSRESDLESWQGQLAVLSDQVSLSTISVTFTAVKDYVPSEKPAERSGFTGGLANGWDAFTDLLGGLAVLVGSLIPFIPFFAVIIWAIWFWRRRVTTRRLSLAGVPSGMQSAGPVGGSYYYTQGQAVQPDVQTSSHPDGQSSSHAGGQTSSHDGGQSSAPVGSQPVPYPGSQPAPYPVSQPAPRPVSQPSAHPGSQQGNTPSIPSTGPGTAESQQ